MQLPAGTAISFPDGSTSSTFLVTFQPNQHLTIADTVTFEFRVPFSYSAMPPAVTCVSGWEKGCPVAIDDGGRLQLNILQLGDSGWIRGYTISDVIHSIHQKLLVADMPQVKVIPSPAATSRWSTPTTPALASGEFGLQGKRPTMEDQTVCIDRLPLRDSSRKISFYAVFDGHGGATASKYASERLHVHLISNLDGGVDLTCVPPVPLAWSCHCVGANWRRPLWLLSVSVTWLVFVVW